MSFFTREEKSGAVGQSQEPLKPHPASKTQDHFYKGKITKAKIKESDYRGGEYVMLMIETKEGKAFHNLEFNNKKVIWTDPKSGEGLTPAKLAESGLKKILYGAYQDSAHVPAALDSLPQVAEALMGLPVKIHVTQVPGKEDKVYTRLKFGKLDYEDRLDAPLGGSQGATEDQEDIPF